MENDYEIDFDQTCPKCGFTFSHFRDCNSFNCDEGMADASYNDPINYAEGEVLFICPECKGRGVIEWCPNCGYEYSGKETQNPEIKK